MAAPNTMHNLTTLIKRLEAATSRLEDIATYTEAPKETSALRKGAEASTGGDTFSAPPPNSLQPLLEVVEEFDIFIGSSVEKYIQLSNDLGGLIAQQASEVLKGFQEQRKFILLTTRAAKPEFDNFPMVLKPTHDALRAVTELRESSRSDPAYTQLSAVADGIMMLAWVTVDSRPHKHVEECLGAAQFFGNRVLKEQKEKNPKQVDWIQSFYQIFRDLSDYIKQYFPSGITWNPKGEPAEEVFRSISASDEASALPPAISGPPQPPPPPPGPPPVLEIKTEPSSGVSASKGGIEAVFSEINRGSDITQGLRKVEKSQMTHKNPSLRAGSAVSSSDLPAREKSPAPGKKPKPESMRIRKPAKKLEGNKWTLENYDKESKIEIEASQTQSVLISRCNNATVLIKGKANQITVDNSSRLSLIVNTLISTVDVVKAQSFALQVLEFVPTVMLDQVDGAQIYLSKQSTGTKLFTSKSNGINLNVITGPDDDYKEVPLPSQIFSFYDQSKGELVNEIVAHAG